jgi:hypothetical protein
LVIVAIERPDIISVKDLVTNKVMKVHTSRLRLFRHPANMGIEEISALAAVDLDEFYVEKIINHVELGKDPKKWRFRVRWQGYEPEDDTWLEWSAVKDLVALDEYSKEHPELNLG